LQLANTLPTGYIFLRQSKTAMELEKKNNQLTKRDRLKAKALTWSPLLIPFLITFPLPIVFLFLFFVSIAPAAAAFYFFAALISFGIGALLSIGAIIFLLVYRKAWLKRLRDRLAKDGVTASELEWFMPELKTAERKALKEMEKQNALLADAYRETLASRITAARVIETSKRELLLVQRRINKANYMKGSETKKLLEELNEDRARLNKIQTEAKQLNEDAEARLQMIEATARRSTSWSEVETSLQRLTAARDHLPLALEIAKIEQEIRSDVEKELLAGGSDEPKQLETDGEIETQIETSSNEPTDIYNDSLTRQTKS
jgi:hypothetical protein